MAAQVKDAAWMQWITALTGGTSRQTCTATYAPDRYHCLLDELPVHLIPRRSFGILQQDFQGPLFVDSGCNVCSAGRVPDELIEQQEQLACFALQGTIAWVRDPANELLLPFWVGTRLGSAIRSLLPEEPAERFLSRDDRRILAAAGILRRKDVLRQYQPLDDCPLRKTFSAKGYVALPDLIHPFHIAALRRYYRCLIRKGLVHSGDRQCPRRYAAHNEPVARFFHYQLAKVVSAIAGELVKPSYVYFSSYRGGAELIRHTDREQCEFSLGLCLDFSPEPERETSWPLCLDTPEGTVAVYQELGDGLLYRGTRLPHYRDVLDDGLTSTSIFFHYVSHSFTGSLA